MKWTACWITVKRNMKLSRNDILFILVGTAVLCGLSFLLYRDMTRHSGPGNTEQIGRITAKRNMAERKYSTQVVWDEIDRNTKLYNFDTVRTSDQSEAIIRLNDGTEINLGENSMILLSLSKKEVDIKFIQGTIHAKQASVKEGGSRETAAKKVTIESGDSKISMNNSDVSLSQDAENKLQVTVNRGKATFKSGKEEKLLNENQNILADKDTIRLYDLTIKLIKPLNDSYVPSGAAKAAVAFAWERLKGNYTTYLEVSNNPSMIDPFYRKNIPGTAGAAALADGIYYWRVTAVGAATRKVESSEIRKLTVVNTRPVQLISPANKSQIKYRDTNPMINFIWSRNESVSKYRLIVSSNPDFSGPAVNTSVENNKIAINSLGQGNYYWKVVSIQEISALNTTSESGTRTFSIARTEKLSPPDPVYPPENKTVHPSVIIQKGLNFAWNKDSALPETEITVAGDRDFSGVVFNRKSGENFSRFTDTLKDGTYYWRLRGRMSDGSYTDYSAIRRFRVSRETALTLIEPPNRSIRVLKGDEKNAPVNFSWSRTEIEGKFILQLSSDKNFGSISKELTLSDASATINAMEEGTYYWRVRLVDEKGAEIASSAPYSFELLGTLDTPAAVAPAAGAVVNMEKKDVLDFRWNIVKGATQYRVGLFQVKKGIQQSIATFETRNNLYQFQDLGKLDVGRFLWTLQALETDPQTNRVRRKSRESRMLFDINLGEKKEETKINLKSPKILYVE